MGGEKGGLFVLKLDQFPNLAYSTAGWCTVSLGRKQKAGSGMGDVTELLPLVLLLTEISVRWCLSLRITITILKETNSFGDLHLPLSFITTFPVKMTFNTILQM